MNGFSVFPIQIFLEELGSSGPAPGGGSVMAICASLASRLTEMVANLPVGRQKYESVEEDMCPAREVARPLSGDSMNLAKKDTEASRIFMGVMDLPKSTDDERGIRKDSMQEALKESTLVPFEVLSLTRVLSANSLPVAVHGNPNAMTDADVSALLAETVEKGAAMSARIKLSLINDRVLVEKSPEQLGSHLAETSRNVHETMVFVDSKLKIS